MATLQINSKRITLLYFSQDIVSKLILHLSPKLLPSDGWDWITSECKEMQATCSIIMWRLDYSEQEPLNQDLIQFFILLKGTSQAAPTTSPRHPIILLCEQESRGQPTAQVRITVAYSLSILCYSLLKPAGLCLIIPFSLTCSGI